MTGDIFALAGAYVLDALDEDERAQFEAYLATSPEARAEVESLREAAAVLAEGAAEPPPPRMKASVMAAIDTVRQDRPVVPLEASPPRRQPAPPATRAWVTKLAYGAAAVAAALAVGLGVAVGTLSDRIDQVEDAGAQVASVVAAEDAERVTVDLPDGGRITAVIAPREGAAIVVGDELRALDEDEMYALWAIVDGQPVPAGELVAGQPATVTADQLDTIGLTVEPRGPLTTPTGEVEALLSV